MMIDELENSDYSKAVADACFCYAKEAGYELELTLYETEGGWKIYSRQEDLPVSTDTVTMAKVCLKYPLTIPMWGMVSRQELTGYAR